MIADECQAAGPSSRDPVIGGGQRWLDEQERLAEERRETAAWDRFDAIYGEAYIRGRDDERERRRWSWTREVSAKKNAVNQWVVCVKAPNGNRKRSRVTSVVVDQEPTLEDIRGAVGGVARLLVDDLWVQQEKDVAFARSTLRLGLPNHLQNELAGHEADAAGE